MTWKNVIDGKKNISEAENSRYIGKKEKFEIQDRL